MLKVSSGDDPLPVQLCARMLVYELFTVKVDSPYFGLLHDWSKSIILDRLRFLS